MADGPARTVASFDGWELLRDPLELRKSGKPVRLQDLPLQILEALVTRPGTLVTREELISRLWPGGVVDFDAGLNTATRKLRVALGDDAEAPRYIETVPRRGYRFVGRIDPGSGAEITPVPEPPPAPAPPPPMPTPAHEIRRRTPWLMAALLGAAIVLAAAAWLFASSRYDGVAPSSQRVRLAILPFDNLSPDSADAFFTEGMHEEVLGALVNRSPALEVVSRGTMLLYRESNLPIPKIADELHATHVLEGSVRREGGMVRVTLQLIEPAQDRPIWSRSFDRELGRAMTLQRELADEIARQLSGTLPAASGRLPPPRNPEAYDLWLKGVLAWQQVGSGGATDEEIARIEALFTRAIESDDTYAAAYADRARVRIARFASRADPSDENIAGARADIARARELAGNSPHVLIRAASLAMLVDRDVDLALRLVEEAERAGPLTADLLMTKANFLMFAGRKESSLAAHAEAARLDPGNALIYRYWLINLFAARMPGEAMAVIGEFDQRFPGRLNRGEHLLAYTGSTRHWRVELDRQKRDADPNATLSQEFDLLRFEGRLETARELAANLRGTYLQHSAYATKIGASPKPVAALRGWVALWSGNAADAVPMGVEMRAFVSGLGGQPSVQWWRDLLMAEAHLFAGDGAAAVAAARQALRHPETTFAQTIGTKLTAARVLAWAGEREEAAALLDSLSMSYPAAGPALLSRDPLFDIPLRELPRWRTLRARLEAEIAANQSLLTP